MLALSDAAEAIAPAADDVVVFEGEAWGIDDAMATVAGFGVAMFVEEFAEGGGAADVGFDAGNAWRRRGRFGAEESVQDEDAAHDGRGVGAVGGDFEDAGVGEDAAAFAIVREGDFLDVEAGDAGDVVVVSEASIEHGEVALDEVGGAEVLGDEFGDEAAGFAEHGVEEESVVFGVKLFVWRGEVDLSEVEPAIGEVGDEAAEGGAF